MPQKHPIRHHGNDPDDIQCNGKRRYPSQAQAETVKEQQELLYPGLVLNTYRCQIGCKGWHLTRTAV